MATSQDHKARDNDDKGPNTGGMGAYSPAPIVTPAIEKIVIEQILQPVVDGMAARGTPYTGFLYAGLMLTRKGPKTLEFNCRFGDPETQPIMMRLGSDFVNLCLLAIDQRLDEAKINWDPRPALGVVMASRNYPDDYPKNEVITGLNVTTGNTKVFHSGTRLVDEQVLTDGGRVLCVTALGTDLLAAQKTAYEAAEKIYWPHAFYRTDIGAKAL